MGNRKEKMLRLRDNGWSLSAIGREYGISKQRVNQIIGNTRRCADNYFSDADYEIAYKMRKDGAYWKDIGERLGYHPKTIRIHMPPDMKRGPDGLSQCSKCKKWVKKTYETSHQCRECNTIRMREYWRNNNEARLRHNARAREKRAKLKARND